MEVRQFLGIFLGDKPVILFSVTLDSL